MFQYLGIFCPEHCFWIILKNADVLVKQYKYLILQETKII
jgi:hypothetical protein